MTNSPPTPAKPDPAPAAPKLAPVHERWPEILRYPLHPGALSTCVAIAVAHLVAHIPVGFILDLLVWAAFFKYAFEVLRWTANGRAEAPEISFTVSDGIARYAMLLFVLSEVSIILLTYLYGPFAGLALGVLLMFGMPAMMIVLALEEGMLRAINPIVWLILAQRIGKNYFVLVGFFVAALIVQSLFSLALAPIVPGIIATPLVYFVVNYLMIVNFHLIGCVIHDKTEELGYTGHLELQEAVPFTDPSRKILDAARERAASGDARGAAQLLREELATTPDAVLLHDEYRHWLRQEGDKAELGSHGKKYISILLAQNQERRALEIARECRTADAEFALDKPEEITRLAHAAAAAGQTQLAVGLLAGFHKRFRNHADIGRNYLLAAKLRAERMNKEMQARALLQQIKVMMPDDPIVPQVDAYLAYLDKLAATPAKSPAP